MLSINTTQKVTVNFNNEDRLVAQQNIGNDGNVLCLDWPAMAIEHLRSG